MLKSSELVSTWWDSSEIIHFLFLFFFYFLFCIFLLLYFSFSLFFCFFFFFYFFFFTYKKKLKYKIKGKGIGLQTDHWSGLWSSIRKPAIVQVRKRHRFPFLKALFCYFSGFLLSSPNLETLSSYSFLHEPRTRRATMPLPTSSSIEA